MTLNTQYIICFQAIIFTTLILLSDAAMAASFLDSLGGWSKENLGGGTWRTYFIGGAFVLVGILFVLGKLNWYWFGGIIIGAWIIVDGFDLAEGFVSFWS